MFISDTIKYLLRNGFKNSFLLYIGLLSGSGYLFYTGQAEAAAALTGTAVAAITINKDDKDDKDDKEKNKGIEAIQIYELQEQLLESKIMIARLEERTRNHEEKNKLQERLFEEKRKTALYEQQVMFLQKGSQQFLLPEGKNQPFDPKIEEKVAEIENPPYDSNIK